MASVGEAGVILVLLHCHRRTTTSNSALAADLPQLLYLKLLLGPHDENGKLTTLLLHNFRLGVHVFCDIKDRVIDAARAFRAWPAPA